MSGTTERDAQALAYLAKRLREETYGAGPWDDAGIWAVIKPLVGRNLAIAIEQVTRHAADPEAKTPGAITRPFLPELHGHSLQGAAYLGRVFRCVLRGERLDLYFSGKCVE